MGVPVTVSVVLVAGVAIRAAAALAGESLTEGHTAVRGGGGAGEHEVAVVGAAHQASGTVAVRVAVSAPQATRLRGGTAGVALRLPATILQHQTEHSIHIKRAITVFSGN